MVPGSFHYLEPWSQHQISCENKDLSTFLFVNTMSQAYVITEVLDMLAY